MIIAHRPIEVQQSRLIHKGPDGEYVPSRAISTSIKMDLVHDAEHAHLVEPLLEAVAAISKVVNPTHEVMDSLSRLKAAATEEEKKPS